MASTTLKAKEKVLDSEGIVRYYEGPLRPATPIVSIEDGCAEDDWDTWKLLNETDRRPRCNSLAMIFS